MASMSSLEPIKNNYIRRIGMQVMSFDISNSEINQITYGQLGRNARQKNTKIRFCEWNFFLFFGI